MISVSMWQYRIGIKRIKIFENVSEKSVLNWYYFGIEVALKGEKPFKITVKIDNFNARIAHKTRKNTRKLLFLTLFYRERRTPKRKAPGSSPGSDATCEGNRITEYGSFLLHQTQNQIKNTESFVFLSVFTFVFSLLFSLFSEPSSTLRSISFSSSR